MLALSGGVRVPQLGFSVAGFRRPDAAKAVRAAIETGYRAIDTDRANEAEVADAIAASGVARDELFVTTKVSAETVLKGFEGHSDMCLLSGPGKESAAALTRLHADGRFRAIGVAGFGVAELRRLIETTGTVPAVNQVELHPWRQQVPLREFHDGHGTVPGQAEHGEVVRPAVEHGLGGGADQPRLGAGDLGDEVARLRHPRGGQPADRVQVAAPFERVEHLSRGNALDGDVDALAVHHGG